ncbi:Phytanoyl-CoA dioxygenase (PhyH) [Burkholderia sp. OK233]|nr:Phytanoyl-CoA dioxygenase (PhyH) [Burkholderia sp. OK233]
MTSAKSIRHVPAGTSADEVDKIIQSDGGVIVDNLFPVEKIARLNAELDPVLKNWAPGIQGTEWMVEFAGRQTKRLTQLVTRSSVFRNEMLDDAALLSYIDTMMLPHADSYWMTSAQLIQLQPGEKCQMLHRDLENWPIFKQLGPDGPEAACNCLVALSEYTEEMGATRVIPGSHKWSDFNDRGSQEMTIAAEMEPGSGFIYSGKVLHGGGENKSNRPRRALAMAYNLGWLVPEEAYPFGVPLEMARQLGPRAQQLLGFRSFSNEIGGGGTVWQMDYRPLAEFLRLDKN